MASDIEVPEQSDSLGRSAQRAFRVIEALSLSGPSSLGKLAKEVGFHKSTVHHVLRTLQSCGYVVQDKESGAYRLTLKLFEVGYRVVANTGLREQAFPYMEELMQETGETVWLAMLDEGEAIRVEKVESRAVMRLSAPIGTRIPLHSTAAGKALLAGNYPLRWQRLLGTHLLSNGSLPAFTDRTITDLARLEEEIVKVRERGYAVDDEETTVSIRAIAAPIHDFRGEVTAAVSVAGPDFRLHRRRFAEIGSKVIAAAHRIEMMSEECKGTLETAT